MGRVQGKLTGLLLAAACAVLGACSHSGGNSSAPLIKRHPGGAGAASFPAGDVDPGPTDLVSAVSSGGGGEGPIGLKFQLGQRPVAGQPLVITLRLVANQALEHVEARFHTDEGLRLTQGVDFDPGGALEAGASVDHTLTLVPDHDGVYTVLATVTTGSAAEALSRSFVIPIVVGMTPPEPPAAVAAKRK